MLQRNVLDTITKHSAHASLEESTDESDWNICKVLMASKNNGFLKTNVSQLILLQIVFNMYPTLLYVFLKGSARAQIFVSDLVVYIFVLLI